jgi:hypothetical protein
MKKEETFVYICRAGDNEELRYSIRSVIKYFPNAKIWVVGEPPEWYDGDYIKIKQDGSKYANAFKNMRSIISSSKIPEEFVMMNDDFYIIKDPKAIEYFYEGTLQEKHDNYFDAYQNSTYTSKIGDTLFKLKKLGYSNPLSYELHVPFPVEKWKLARAIKHDGLLWRSIYGNMFDVGGTLMNDVKVYSTSKMNFKKNNSDNDSCYMSTDDTSFLSVYATKLSKMFPKKTIYEKPDILKPKPLSQ